MLLLLVIGGIATAQTVSVADVYVKKGTTAAYALVINVGYGSYTGFQYHIAFPSTGFSTPESNKSTVNSVQWDGGSISPGSLTSGEGNVSALSNSNSALPVGNFAVGTVSFSVDENVEVGTYPVHITNFEFLSGDTRQAASNISFNVHITDRVVLDENSTIAPTAQNGVNVTVNRTIQAGVWNTICLPFNMTEAQLKAAFGDDVKLCYFKDYSISGDDITINLLSWPINTQGFRANYPYIIKTGVNIESFNIDNVNIVSGTPEKTYSTDFDGTIGKFVGTLKAGTTIPENNLFLNANKLYYSTGSTVIKGFRGYFWLKDFNPSANAPTFKVDGGTTRVEGLSVVTDDGTIYNLNGQKVETPAQKGVYIKNGKKVILK